MRTRWWVVWVAVVTVSGSAFGQGTPIGFEERFALAEDRGAVLEELIPGTPDFYFFTCLHAQHEGRLTDVTPLLKTWIERHGRSERVQEIEQRQLLLGFERWPDESYAELRQRLGLSFDHRSKASGAESLPSRLESDQVSWAAFRDRALQQAGLNGFNDSALDELLSSDLNDERMGQLLHRLPRPDVPNLVDHVERDLRRKSSGGFGSRGVHDRLLLSQLDDLARRMPELLGQSRFVDAWMRRLAPPDGTALSSDPTEKQAYLERLEAFTRRLPPSMASLHAHVLHHRLAFDQRRGVYDKTRFLEYARMPRSAAWMDDTYVRRASRNRPLVALNSNFATGLTRIDDDTSLVRSYLEHFLLEDASLDPFSTFIAKRWLERLLAETMLLAGRGDPERWYSLLNDPAALERLRSRVELTFARDLPAHYQVDDPVALTLDVKNVETLLVKVFELDVLNIARDQGTDPDASLDLDGLVATEETTYTYDEPPLRRMERTFEFPQLNRPGVFVVECIGNGVSSRAVIRKGALRAVERSTPSGHAFRVFDESGNAVDDAAAWIAGRRIEANDDGELIVPFTTDAPQRRSMVLVGAGRTSRTTFDHAAETYQLQLGAFVAREALRSGTTARLVLRPHLWASGAPASVTLLTDPVLSIRTYGASGILASQDVRDLPFADGVEMVHEFSVPSGLRRVEVSLKSRLQPLTQDDALDLVSNTVQFSVNDVQATLEVNAPLLGQSADGYLIEVRGRNGEAVAGETVSCLLYHPDFTQPVSARLRSDQDGMVHLGPLTGLHHVTATLASSGRQASWPLETSWRSSVATVHGVVGRALVVRARVDGDRPTRDAYSLFEVRRGALVADRFEHLRHVEGALVLRDLPAGHYRLTLAQSSEVVDVHVIDLAADGGRGPRGWWVGEHRALQRPTGLPLIVSDVSMKDEALVIDLATSGPDARVHVFTSHYIPGHDPARALRSWAQSPGRIPLSPVASAYRSGRALGEEYRYILDRRSAPKFVGSMLERPGLLLNPWALAEAETQAAADAKWGEDFAGEDLRRAEGEKAKGEWSQQQKRSTGHASFATLDFLPTTVRWAFQGRPDADGTLRIPAETLGDARLVHVIAMDSDETVYARVARDTAGLTLRDQRLQLAMDPEVPVTQRRRVDYLAEGDTVELPDLATSQMRSYATVASLFALYQTTNPESGLSDWAFLLEWPTMDDAAKKEAYDEFACHELHFFLHQRDRAFFNRIIRPYLSHKLHKTFLDHWLLEDDLSGYVTPWAFARLNLVEKILLGQRRPEAQEAARRHAEDLLAAIPPNLQRKRRMVELGLESLVESTLDLNDKFSEARKNARITRGLDMRPDASSGEVAPEPQLAFDARLEADSLERLGYLTEEARGRLRELGYADDQAGMEGVYFETEALKRSSGLALYRGPRRTRSFIEHDYWHRTTPDATPIVPGAFWVDYASAEPGEPFASSHALEPTHSVTEMIFALAVLNLPFSPDDHQFDVEGEGGRLTAAGPLLVVRQELAPATDAENASSILVRQTAYRVGAEPKEDGALEDVAQCTVGVPYGLRVVLTNPTDRPRVLEVLQQIPRGAIALGQPNSTESRSLALGPWQTQRLDLRFYFPATGAWSHFPVHVSESGDLVASAEARAFTAVDEPPAVDRESWEYLSQRAPLDDVLTYLAEANLQTLDLSALAWRMNEKSAFDAVTGLLRSRMRFDPTLWSYGVKHCDDDATSEYLQHVDSFLRTCGPALVSPLVTIEPVERGWYRHVEFRPLVNPRAHAFAGERRILNAGFAAQYLSFLNVLSHQPHLTDQDWLEVTDAMLLQDRVEEALAAFARIDPRELSSRLQYDLIDVQLAMAQEDAPRARALAAMHADHPIPHWRERFQEALAHLDEAEGARLEDAEGTRPQDVLASSEPILTAELVDGALTLNHRDLAEAEVRYYGMDVEFLFSSSPFVQQGAGAFSSVRPNRVDRVALEGDRTAIPLPDEFQREHALIEVRAGGLVRRVAHYAHSFAVQVIESYGQVRVTDAVTGEPLPKTYVKVYGRLPSGRVRFHRDGYTDHRGRFDYASLSGEAEAPAQFSLLVLSDQRGAVIREAGAPLR